MKRLTKVGAATGLTGALLFGTAGTLNWWNAWGFLVINTISVAAVTFGIFAKNPNLEEERATARAKSKGWDKIIVPFVVALPVLNLVVAGLDHRHAWTHFSIPGSSIVGLFSLGFSNSLAYFSMRANPFFSSHVRIQSDRGHEVIKHGPYSFIRHPGYLGIIGHSISLGLLLESVPALGVGLLSGLVTLFRTFLEDRTLMKELPGYRAYAKTVRFRLIPGFW